MGKKTLYAPKFVCSVLTDGEKHPCKKTLCNLRKGLRLEEDGLCVRDGKSYLYTMKALERIDQRTRYNFTGFISVINQ